MIGARLLRVLVAIVTTVAITLHLVRFPRGAQLRRVWLIAVVIYAAIRALIADYFLRQYGVRGEVYFLVEIATSIPFGHYSANLISRLANDEAWLRPGLLTALFYLLPDLYLFVALDAPVHIYLWAALIVVLLTIRSLFWLRRRIRSAAIN